MNLYLNVNKYLKDNIICERHTILDGTSSGIRSQYIFAFDNGYGASVVKCNDAIMSYGFEEDLWELALLKEVANDYPESSIAYEDDKHTLELAYEPIVNFDVIGHMTDAEVNEVLERIKKGDIYKSYSEEKEKSNDQDK